MKTSKKPTVTIAWHRGLIPLSLLLAFILITAFDAPLWVLALFCAWIPVFYIGYPRYLDYRWKSFEKQFHLYFQREDYKGLLAFYHRQLFLKHCGPKAEMLSKLGLIYSAMGKFREAEYILEKAIAATNFRPDDHLGYNLANIKYELGKYDEARQIYQSLRGNLPYKQSIKTQLALINYQQGIDVQEARQILERERRQSTGIMRTRIDQALSHN